MRSPPCWTGTRLSSSGSRPAGNGVVTSLWQPLAIASAAVAARYFTRRAYLLLRLAAEPSLCRRRDLPVHEEERRHRDDQGDRERGKRDGIHAEACAAVLERLDHRPVHVSRDRDATDAEHRRDRPRQRAHANELEAGPALECDQADAPPDRAGAAGAAEDRQHLRHVTGATAVVTTAAVAEAEDELRDQDRSGHRGRHLPQEQRAAHAERADHAEVREAKHAHDRMIDRGLAQAREPGLDVED